MKRRTLVPLVIVAAALVASVLYFEVFRHITFDDSRIEGSGTIEVTEVEISTKIAGRVASLPFEEGSAVKRGDLVAKLEFEELSASHHSARANLVNAERNLMRIRDLHGSGSVSRRDLDNAETAYRVAKANVDYVNASILNAVIYAPIDGVVLERNLEAGEMAFPGSAIITLADLKRPWIKIYVPQPKLHRVKLNQKAEVTIDGTKKRFSGKVVAISNKAEFTPKAIQTKDERVKLMFAVKIAVENPAGELKPGMPADAAIIIEGAR